MLGTLLALWTALAAQGPDSAARARYALALKNFDDSLAAVHAAAVAFRVDLATASRELVLARARRLELRCAAGRRAADSLAALLKAGTFTASQRVAAARARRDLGAVDAMLAACERDYDIASPRTKPDTLKAWAPYRLSRFEGELRRHEENIRLFTAQAGVR